ncbi:AAA family ATPase [Roseomonas terrae]|uniref:AAA family ATPase n=1 Tax=Neoroseomonas terrae TaxID=424799 RepID=A0ABS5EL57_9PROT|nr:DEAD/DEAH box helicase [Neoroseomonas terrae]MBR0651759.1 AAA family ATPase [Neoroseomonas terrae]
MVIELNEEQDAALRTIRSFLRDDALDAFILRGSAGTGKTTLIAALTAVLEEMELSFSLLAPTGRAARILGNKVRLIRGTVEGKGSTIHSRIFKPPKVEVNEEAESANDPGVRLVFPLSSEEAMEALFVIDEASMVGDRETPGDYVQFGSGRLLQDLVTYARIRRPGRGNDHRTKLLFVGDPAQLPPVGEDTSPALSEEYLQTKFGLRIATAELNSVVRQAAGSAILARATEIRDALRAKRFNTFTLKPFDAEVEKVDPERALDLIVESLRAKESTVAVVFSNAMALDYNRAVRDRLWGDADLPIQVGDTLLVNRNSRPYQLSNGDLVKVLSVRAECESVLVPMKGIAPVELRFREAEVAFRDVDGTVIRRECLLLENLLASPMRDISPAEQRALLVHFRMRYPQLKPHMPAFRLNIADDGYFNALQVKYGYAMTCHKAQGGEWHSGIVHFSLPGDGRNSSSFRWAYTAITRAVKRLVVVNPPDFTDDSDMKWNIPSIRTELDERKDFTADPDWNRLSFSSQLAALMTVHQQLRGAWQEQGITIEQLQHLQYCERYSLQREGKRAVVQYWYDGKFRVGRSGTAPGAFHDATLADEALAAFQRLSGGPNARQPEPFIQEFLSRLDAAMTGASIQRTGHEVMRNRLRVTFADATRRGAVDFIHNDASTWTAAQEVGGPGSSRGLYEEVQGLMAMAKA